MDEIEKGLKEFLDYWFAGFMRGIESLDEPSQRKVLYECGKACAHCECSAANLRENLQQSLGMSASVAVESSIHRGGTHCVLIVSLEMKHSIWRYGTQTAPNTGSSGQRLRR